MESAAGHLSPAASTPLCINLTHVAHSLHWFSRVRQHHKDKEKSKDKDTFCTINSQVQLNITLPWRCWRASHKTSANTRWKVIWLIPIKKQPEIHEKYFVLEPISRDQHVKTFHREPKNSLGAVFVYGEVNYYRATEHCWCSPSFPEGDTFTQTFQENLRGSSILRRENPISTALRLALTIL